MSGLERPAASIVWDLRKWWAARDVDVCLTLEPRCMVTTVIGRVTKVSVTGAFVEVDGWHIPTDVILRVERALVEQAEAYRDAQAEAALAAGEDHL